MRVIGKTDVGKVRKTNQDAFACGTFRDGGVYAVVCDGMGGVNGGSVASSTAVRVLKDRIEAGYTPELEAEGIRDLLRHSVQAANTEVFSLSRQDPSLYGMGTTVIAAVASPKTEYVHVVHAGDSRVYTFDGQTLSQLTHDHSIVQEMVDSGKISPEEARVHPQKNIITRALGVEETLDIDLVEKALSDLKVLLICSDGLTNHVETETIEQVLLEPSAPDADQAEELCAQKLISLANEDGGSDNITVVLLSTFGAE